MIAYLADCGYVKSNTFSLCTSGQRTDALEIDRYLTPAAWTAVFDTLETLPTSTATQVSARERALFVITWTEATGARPSELARAKMADVRYANHSDDSGWWWYIKDTDLNSTRVPVTDYAMAALQRYRQHLGLPAQPSEIESAIALVWQIRGKNRSAGVTRSLLYESIKRVFLKAATQAEDGDPNMAERLRSACISWIRNTAATNALAGDMPIADVQQLMRHSSPNITARHYHRDDGEFHERAQRKSPLKRDNQ
ncbi:tyrosine-type recombinase/integrase [Salinisphaera hydrothermalis]|uniref:tyrosine-type recombinase/integrase n=1 Tax=Salinisphaera hydrothermalis TaxID=563188 RepID=UPI00333FCFED